MTKSKVFRSLSKWSMLVVLDFLCKRQMGKIKSKSRSDEWTILNNGEIVYPYKEAVYKGISRRQFRNAIDELMEKGFIDITHQGSGGRAGDMTTYFVDTRWKNYGTPNFEPANIPRKKNNKQGQGWAVSMSDPIKKKKIMEKRQQALHKKKQSSVLKTTPRNPVYSVKSNTSNTIGKDVSIVNINTPKTTEQPAITCG